MAKNYIQEGDVMDHIAAANLVSGQMILVGKRVGVVVADISTGQTGAVAMEGVFSAPKLSTDVVAQGDLLYWDDTNKRLTITATANTLAGYAFAAAGNGVAAVNININH